MKGIYLKNNNKHYEDIYDFVMDNKLFIGTMVDAFFDVSVTDKKFHKASVYAELLPTMLIPTDEEVEVDLSDIQFALESQGKSCVEGLKITTRHSQFILHELVNYLR
jgi:hypothetical protein